MEKPIVRPPKAVPDDSKPLVENASDAGQVREARKRVRTNRKQLTDDMAAVLGTPPGRRIVKHYLDFCRVFHGGRVPIEDVQFNEGMRNVGLKLLHHVEQARPDLISIMKD